MISKEIRDMINKQINTELWSAYYYLAMSVDARHKNVMGVSNWFFIQAREELDHSRILQNYMFLQNAEVQLHPIKAVEGEWASPNIMFEDAFNHERIVTQMIHHIVKKAQQEQDYATQSMLTWFVDEQVNEENACNKLRQEYREANNNPCILYQIDNKLKMRRYERPHVLRGENWIA